MYSFNWPNIFTNSSTRLLEDKKAAISNLRLVLGAEKAVLLGDPYFGTNIRKYTFTQLTILFKDLLVDEIYTSIRTYVPQIRCKREDITIEEDRAKIYVNVNFRYVVDQQLDTFSIDLLDKD